LYGWYSCGHTVGLYIKEAINGAITDCQIPNHAFTFKNIFFSFYK